MTTELITNGPLKGWYKFIIGKIPCRATREIKERKLKSEKHIKIIRKMREERR